MKDNFNGTYKIEKIVEENPLFILLDSKVIVKNKKEKITFYLNQISNVRVKKLRDRSPSVIALVNLILFYLLFLSTLNLSSTIKILCVTVLTILFIISFFIKKYTYKLVINQGKFKFNEITITKDNNTYAEKLIATFENRKARNRSTTENLFQQLKEAL